MITEIFFFLPLPGAPSHYREAYPYGPAAGTFHTDLAIEIDPATLANSPALAVISGMFRWIPDAASPTTGTLILAVNPGIAEALFRVFHSTMVFVYRNIEFASMLSFFEPRIKAIKGTAFEEDSRLDGFIHGQYPVWVDAGEKLGVPSLSNSGWGRLGFEIVFVPPLGRGPAALARLLQLISPLEATRRLDPMSFYAEVAINSQWLTLALPHANHLLLTLPTRRILLELRDEYDAPSNLELGVLDSVTNATTTFQFDPLQYGTVVLDTAPSTGAPATRGYSISKTNYLFTALPSGQGAYQFQGAAPTAPFHWALQALFMPPSNSLGQEHESWFVPNTIVAATPPLSRYTSGNRVTPIRDGRSVFQECVEAIAMAVDSDDFILMANWWFDDTFRLVLGDPFSTLEELYTLAASKGVNIRALLFKQPWDPHLPLSIQNAAEVDRINNLGVSHAKAILDSKTLSIGSHHQKFMVVKGVNEDGEERVIAFCGGVDFNANRRDSHSHLAFGGYHDIHAKVEGPAVADIFQSFKDRWDIHPSGWALPLTLDPSTTPSEGTVFVQVARTYPVGKGYPFALQGSYTPLEALLRAIEKAKKFIYIEDQYLTPYPGLDPSTGAGDTLHVLDALKDALTRIDYLIIVIPNHTELAWFKKLIAYADGFGLLPPGLFLGSLAAELPGQARFRRKMFIRGLKSNQATRSKVHVFYLGRNRKHDRATSLGLDEAIDGDGDLSSGGENYRNEIYCHSKVWIIDDIIAKIGSANCNMRSYTHDSEMDLVMLDGSLYKGARAMARNFRMELWAEHLGLGRAWIGMLEDHLHALEYWLHSESPSSHVREYEEEKHASDNPLLHLGWSSIIDPDGR